MITLLPLLAFLFTGSAAYLGTATPATIASRFAPPANATRAPARKGSFALYLRTRPLKSDGSPVMLFNGLPKARQDVHAAVVAMDIGRKDLQQCADAIMRLRAEHLFASGQQDHIAFRFTNGFKAEWRRWRNGERIRVAGNKCTWTTGAAPDASHAQLRKYLDMVFTYAGTLSLAGELEPASSKPLEAGDVFIQGGSPGHAVIVIDVARTTDGRTYFMLAQSYMPAQEIHVLRNLDHPSLGAWFLLDAGPELRTPEWTFAWNDRKCWP